MNFQQICLEVKLFSRGHMDCAAVLSPGVFSFLRSVAATQQPVERRKNYN